MTIIARALSAYYSAAGVPDLCASIPIGEFVIGAVGSIAVIEAARTMAVMGIVPLPGVGWLPAIARH